MPRVGFIGTGNLGTMLVRGFLAGGAAGQEEITIFNRTAHKARLLKDEYPRIGLASCCREVMDQSELVFVCVKPADFQDVLAETGRIVPRGKVLVSTLLAPSLAFLETIVRGGLARVYPSVTQSTGRGVSLVAFGSQLEGGDRDAVQRLMESIGKVFVLPEKLFRACGDITSCGPAFMSFMTGSLARVAARHGVEDGMAVEMARETMLGSALLLQEENMSFERLVECVATPGGTTAEGIRVLDGPLDRLVEEVFQATARRDREVTRRVEEGLKEQGQT